VESVVQFHREQDVEIVEDRPLHDGFMKVRILRLRHRRFDGGWSPLLTRELVQRRAAVGVLLFDPRRDEVALIEQFRVGALRDDKPWLLELVAGLLDVDGESPEAVARREAVEEANCTIDALEPIADYFSSPGASNEFIHLYCGRCDLSGAGGLFGLAEEGEDIRVSALPTARAFELLDGGHIRNAMTLIALHWLRYHRQRLRELWA
jgi:ADP-ribose pyrophosphatase